jgi:hypothetical protein
MTTAQLSQPSWRIHNIVEYIKYSGDFLCDMEELEERGIQEILQEDFNIYQALKSEELEELKDEFFAMALENEVREAKFLFNKIKPSDEGHDLVHSESKDIYGRSTTHNVYYSYPVDENLRKLSKIRYPLKPITWREMNQLGRLNKIITRKKNTEYTLRRQTELAPIINT